MTQGGNQRMDVRETGEMKNNGGEKGAGRRREDKETGVRQQKLKIKMNALARRSLLSEKARQFLLPVLGPLSIKIFLRSQRTGSWTHNMGAHQVSLWPIKVLQVLAVVDKMKHCIGEKISRKEIFSQCDVTKSRWESHLVLSRCIMTCLEVTSHSD